MDEFSRLGYLVVDAGLGPKVSAIRRRFIETFDAICRLNDLGEIRDDADIVRLYRGEHRPIWVGAYDTLRFLPELHALAADPALLALAPLAHISFPAFANRLILRVDMPSDDERMFRPHQDFVYNHGSLNSVTLWIPFQDIDASNGPLSVIPGSHLRGHLPQSNGLLATYGESAAIDVPMQAGQVLMFSQFLAHRSGFNRSNGVRFSLQVRYNDLLSREYAKRKYFINMGEARDPDFETYYPTE
jgi:phytanoyl-CoA hydroxylase